MSLAMWHTVRLPAVAHLPSVTDRDEESDSSTAKVCCGNKLASLTPPA
jgi:hypothetical protein